MLLQRKQLLEKDVLAFIGLNLFFLSANKLNEKEPYIEISHPLFVHSFKKSFQRKI